MYNRKKYRPHSEEKITDYGFPPYHFLSSESEREVNTPQPQERVTSTSYGLPIVYIYINE